VFEEILHIVYAFPLSKHKCWNA